MPQIVQHSRQRRNSCPASSQSPRFRLANKLAAERGEYDTRNARRPLGSTFENVRAAFAAARKLRRP